MSMCEYSRSDACYVTFTTLVTDHFSICIKEALAITWPCEKYIMRKQILIETGHKPLVPLLKVRSRANRYARQCKHTVFTSTIGSIKRARDAKSHMSVGTWICQLRRPNHGTVKEHMHVHANDLLICLLINVSD